MFELNLKYETSQQTDIEPSILVDKIFIYLKNDYKILEKTDHKVAFAFNNGSGMLYMSKSNRFKVIQDGIFEIHDGIVTLTYYENIIFYILFISVGLFFTAVANRYALMLSILPTIELLSKIRTLKRSSRIMIKYITSNSPLPTTTKFKSIRLD
jgi:hypothetical protein